MMKASTLTFFCLSLSGLFRPAAALQKAAPSGSSEKTSDHALDLRARQRLIVHQKRVDIVVARLLRVLPEAARRDSLPYVGLRVADQKAKENALLAEALGLRGPEHPFVFSVDPTGPAGIAGLEPADQLLEVAGKPLSSSKAFYKITSRSSLAFPLRVAVLRDGHERRFEIPAAYRPRGLEFIVVGDGRNVYAFTTVREIRITSGMLNFLESDSELAVILGHEIAHVTKGHFSTSYRDGAFQPYFSQALENEADVSGLELVQRAGYDPSVAVSLWERFDARLPREGGAPWLMSHPPNQQRIGLLRQTAERLETAPTSADHR